MNTNNTPVEYPTWHDGVIHYPPTAKTQDHNPDPSDSTAIAPIPTPQPAQLESNSRPIPHLKTPPERHTRKCVVCNHEDREAIEEGYLTWADPELIARQFSRVSYWSVYRHAQATGMAALRRRRMHAALDQIIERAGSVRVTGSDVIRAIITSSRLTEDGVYIEPVRRTQIEHKTTSDTPLSNRKPKLLETPLTPTK